MHDANAANGRAIGQSPPATAGRSVLPAVVSPEERRKARDALLVNHCASSPNRANASLDDALRVLAAVHDDLRHARGIAAAHAEPEQRYSSLHASVRSLEAVIREHLRQAGVFGAESQ